MEDSRETASAGGEDDDGIFEIEIDFTQALRGYWKGQEKEEQE